MSARRPAQTATIENWLPENVANARMHHMARHRAHSAAKQRAWVAATFAGWVPVQGRARLVVTFVVPDRRYLLDTDNLYSRAKGCVDGLKGHWFRDDGPEDLDLEVRQVVEPKTKGVRLALEPATRPATPPAEEGR